MATGTGHPKSASSSAERQAELDQVDAGRRMIKPHIRWSPMLKQWRCAFNDAGTSLVGFGTSQVEAYLRMAERLHWEQALEVGWALKIHPLACRKVVCRVPAASP